MDLQEVGSPGPSGFDTNAAMFAAQPVMFAAESRAAKTLRKFSGFSG